MLGKSAFSLTIVKLSLRCLALSLASYLERWLTCMHSKQRSLRSSSMAEYTFFLELFRADLGALLDFIWYQEKPQ